MRKAPLLQSCPSTFCSEHFRFQIKYKVEPLSKGRMVSNKRRRGEVCFPLDAVQSYTVSGNLDARKWCGMLGTDSRTSSGLRILINFSFSVSCCRRRRPKGIVGLQSRLASSCCHPLLSRC